MRLLKIVPDNTNLPFVSLRRWAFALTLLLSIGAVGLVFARGLNLGVDFVGGLMIEEKFGTPPSLDKLRKTVDRLGLGEVRLQTVGSDGKTVSIKLPPPKATDDGATARIVEQVKATVVKDFPDATFSKQDSVSGKVSDELIWKGVLAVVLAVLGIGYSINDKIVIDDRIRENMRRYRKMDMSGIVDLSVNETLPRTVMTSLTILLALLALLIFGGHVLRGFTAAMILGIIVGTYSSIYVSSSLLISLGLRPDPKVDETPAVASPNQR